MSRSADRSDAEPIHHLALPTHWEAAQADGVYAVSTRGRSLADEGFIHAADRHQVEGVANRYYADLDHLVLLTIDPELVGAEVRWEPAVDGADEHFPHVYGPLPVAAVIAASDWHRSPPSPWQLPNG